MTSLRSIAAAASVAAACAVAACGSDSPAAPTVTSFVGVWQGTTSQGKPISLFITADGVRMVAVDFTIAGTVCTVTPEVFLGRTPPSTAYPVADSAVTITSTGSAGTLTINGSFTTGTTVTGTLTAGHSGCNGNVAITWSAAKVTAPAVDLDGTWTGDFGSTTVAGAVITLNLTQNGANLAGTWTTDNGGVGTVTGTITGNMGSFTLLQTTSGCTGTFSGWLAVHGSPEYGVFVFSGSDCQGAAQGGGEVSR